MYTETKTIEERQLLGELPPDTRGTPEWELLRSEIYLRDKGVCWVCNTFVLLKEYELGHLVDYCMGGKAVWENLAVMHGYCNSIKPHHSTLEEAMKWRLMPRNVINPQTLPIHSTNKSDTMFLNQLSNVNHETTHDQQLLWLSKKGQIIDFFKTNPHLLVEDNNRERSEASQRLAHQYHTTTNAIRKIILEAGLMQKRKPFVQNDNQYFEISNHLQEYVDKFNSLDCTLWSKAKKMGLSSHGLRIVLYLCGRLELIAKADIETLERRTKALNIPMQNLVLNYHPKYNKRTRPPQQIAFSIAN